MTDSITVEQKKSRRNLLALVGAGGAAVVAALLGRNGKAEAAIYTWSSGDGDATGKFVNTGVGRGVMGEAISSDGVKGVSDYGMGVFGVSSSSNGVRGFSGSGTGVLGTGKVAVKAIGNSPYQKALETQGRVKMDCARTVTLSHADNLVTLPTGVIAAANTVVLAMIQGGSGPGNFAFVRRAFRVDNRHIRIQFDKTPAKPTNVGYWIVHTP